MTPQPNSILNMAASYNIHYLIIIKTFSAKQTLATDITVKQIILFQGSIKCWEVLE
jgi:hypothetical protein